VPGLVRSAIPLAVLLGPACAEAINPLERDAGEAGIAIEVVGCDLDQVTGNVTATVELTSEREYTTVLVDFNLVDAEGVVVASTSTSATNVKPGQTYRLQMPLSPAGELGQGFTCEAELNLATEPFGE
jgi:hypothetical protein